MGIKLGEMLVKAGKITIDELDAALKNQVIFGGKLGTNLIETGSIDEQELANFLSKKLGVPCIDLKQLHDIPAGVISLLPREIAEKHKVVPFRLENRRLSLIMADPLDFDAIDLIAFSTGNVITPLVAPELQLFYALEKYYKIKPQMRYRHLASGGRSVEKKKKTEDADSRLSAEPLPNLFTPDSETLVFPEFEGFDKLPGESEPDWAYVRNVAMESPTRDQLLTKLTECRERDEIAELATRYLGQEFVRSALFLIKGGQISGWRAIVNQEPVEDFESLQLPLSEPSTLKLVNDDKKFYLGPIMGMPIDKKILAALNNAVPPAVLLIPLIMMGRVVAILYLDGEQHQLGLRLSEIQKLVGKMAMALEILILKNKILMT